MEIKKENVDGRLCVQISGRLDTNTAPQLQEALQAETSDIKRLELNLQDLVYISSAGLRVILFLNKQCMKQEAEFVVINCSDVVKEVFHLTGFDDVLDIQ